MANDSKNITKQKINNAVPEVKLEEYLQFLEQSEALFKKPMSKPDLKEDKKWKVIKL